MAAMILDGRPVAAAIRAEIAREVAAFRASNGWVPGLAVVQVGTDPASQKYAQQIERSFQVVGMRCTVHSLPPAASQADVLELVAHVNADQDTHGVIVQVPLPKHLDAQLVQAAIAVAKDVDGVTPWNAGLLVAGSRECLVPATPAGAMLLLAYYGIAVEGKRAVVLGRSAIVGKPMALLLLNSHATVSVCHTRTSDIGCYTREADLLVVAVGKPAVVQVEMVKPGAVVIDFGVNVVAGALMGDVDFASVCEVASAITPVPGGTGPMTNVVLMRNTLLAATRAVHRSD